MAVTTNWSGQYNGLAFGAGQTVQLVSLDGLRGLPEIRSGDVDKAQLDGSFAGLNFLGERVLTATLAPFNPAIPFETAIAAIGTAFQSISDPTYLLPFEFLLPGWANSRIVNCRPTNGAIPIDTSFQFNSATVQVELTAPDPLIYSSVAKSASSGLPSPTAGLTFPVTFPVSFGASSGGSMSVTNSGNYTTAPKFTITGPCTNPIITFTATGQFMQFNITLGPTDSLVIDMAARTAILNGTASRYNTIVTGSSWFGIPPGTWSIGVGSSDSSSVAAVFTCTWSDAWGWM